MTSPYIITKLFTTVSLRPDQMDNKIYLNLKKNLEVNVLKKCYKNYGYITDIYKIIDYKDGIIEAENLMASATYHISFSCRLCCPLKNTNIICKINRVNKMLVTAENGPILVIVTNDRLNQNVFMIDNYNVLRYKKDTTYHVLKPNDFVKITILSISFNHKDTIIKAIGYLEDVASENEIEQYYRKDVYGKDTEEVEFNQYANDILEV